MSFRQWSSAARFGGPGVLLGLALAWLLSGQRGVHAQASSASAVDRARPVAAGQVADSGGTIAMIAPLHTGSPEGTAQRLYLIDTKSRAFAVYRIDPTHDKGTIKLEGVRKFHWDMQLEAFNNQEPDVHTIATAVKAAGGQSR